MFGLRWVSVATSALLLPWVMSAKISDSRSVSPSLRPGQFSPPLLRAREGGSLITMSPAWIASRAATRSPRPQRFGQIPVDALPAGVLDQVGVEVPCVDRDSAGARVSDQHADLVMVGFRLRETVVQDDVNQVGNGDVGVELGDHYAVLVLLENVGDAHHHDVVVVDQRDGDRCPYRGFHKLTLTSLRV